MRNSNVKAWLIALLVALMPCVAGAAGLGRLTVLTSIGQPLIAEIDLVAVTAQELSSLSARLALPEVYVRSNLQYNPALAGARTTIEKRPNGQSYLRIATTRPVTEPFIDLLVELTWASGRLSREYTALLDPPGIPPAPPAPIVATAPAVVPTPAPQPAPQPPAAVAAEPRAPVAAAVEPRAPIAAPAPAVSTPIAAAPIMAGSKEYGPIERGETLGKIARSVMPEGVTLEQMLVALYRTNQEAFIRNNLNLVRAGKILRVPDRDEIEAISRSDAVQEYRTHVADWNAYRQKLAEAAVTVPAEGRTAVSGKITTKVEDKAASGAPKDVVKLSKGEPPGTVAGKGKPRSAAERVRMLEEEAVAREKALAEANSRVAQLEKTIQNMKKLAELKSPGMAAAQQQAAAQKPAAKPAPKPEAAKMAEPVAKPEAKEPAAVAVAKPAAPAPADKPVAAQPEPVKPAAVPPSQPVAAAKPKPKPAPAPQKPEPELMDQVLAAATDPLYLGTGGVILLGGLAFWMARRRRSRTGVGDSPPIAPRLSTAAATAAEAAATTEDSSAAPPAETTASAAGDDVDPMQEAEVYIQYGRDGQAEEILKEAIARDPQRQDVQLKLLEIYAARKDRSAFGKVAADLNKLTGGAGDNWRKAGAMGYALDPDNRLYEAGKDAEVSVVAARGVTSTDIDLDLGGGAGTATDIALESGFAEAADDSAMLNLGAADTGQSAQDQAAPAMPDFTLEVPPAGTESQPDIALDATPAPAPAWAPAQDSNVIDFQIDLPKITAEPSTVASKPAAASGDNAGLEFKLDGLNLDLESEPKTQAGAGGGEKDGHWYDVQTKFDLAKAYQEMGDKDGAKEILQEVIKEGDAKQKAQATTLLDSLG